MDSQEFTSVLTTLSLPDSLHPTSDAGWVKAVSKHKARKLRKSARQATEASTDALWASTETTLGQLSPENNTATRGSRRRLPPLPKGDIKIVIRPRRGLCIKDHSIIDISRAISGACANPQKVAGEYVVRPRNGSNILIVSTPHIEVVDEVRHITSLNLRDNTYDVTAYVPFTEQEKRGVIHGLPEGESSEALMAGLRVHSQGVNILHARMLGKNVAPHF